MNENNNKLKKYNLSKTYLTAYRGGGREKGYEIHFMTCAPVALHVQLQQKP